MAATAALATASSSTKRKRTSPSSTQETPFNTALKFDLQQRDCVPRLTEITDQLDLSDPTPDGPDAASMDVMYALQFRDEKENILVSPHPPRPNTRPVPWSETLALAAKQEDGATVVQELINTLWSQSPSKNDEEEEDDDEYKKLMNQFESLALEDDRRLFRPLEEDPRNSLRSIVDRVLDKSDPVIAEATMDLDHLVCSTRVADAVMPKSSSTDALSKFLTRCKQAMRDRWQRSLQPRERAQLALIWKQQLTFYQRARTSSTFKQPAPDPSDMRVLRIPLFQLQEDEKRNKQQQWLLQNAENSAATLASNQAILLRDRMNAIAMTIGAEVDAAPRLAEQAALAKHEKTTTELLASSSSSSHQKKAAPTTRLVLPAAPSWIPLTIRRPVCPTGVFEISAISVAYRLICMPVEYIQHPHRRPKLSQPPLPPSHVMIPRSLSSVSDPNAGAASTPRVLSGAQALDLLLQGHV